MKLSKKAAPILRVLHRLNDHHKKKYSFPAQKTLLKHMSELCSHTICRRQLNYDLKDMVEGGLIIRQRRHERIPKRGMVFRSSMYKITVKGYRLLVGFGTITWGYFKGIQNSIMQGMSKKKEPCAINPWAHDSYRKNNNLTPLFSDVW